MKRIPVVPRDNKTHDRKIYKSADNTISGKFPGFELWRIQITKKEKN